MKLQSLKKDSKNDYFYHEFKNYSIIEKDNFIKQFDSSISINDKDFFYKIIGFLK